MQSLSYIFTITSNHVSKGYLVTVTIFGFIWIDTHHWENTVLFAKTCSKRRHSTPRSVLKMLQKRYGEQYKVDEVVPFSIRMRQWPFSFSVFPLIMFIHLSSHPIITYIILCHLWINAFNMSRDKVIHLFCQVNLLVLLLKREFIVFFKLIFWCNQAGIRRSSIRFVYLCINSFVSRISIPKT